MKPWRLLFIASALLLAGCPSGRRQEVRLGINPWPGYEYFYLASVKNLYPERDVTVTIVEYNSLADALTAFERKQVDAIGCTIVETAIARNRNLVRPRIACIPDYSKGADMIIGAHGVAELRDLKGKRVAVETGSLGIVLLSRALESVDLTLKDVVVMPSDQLSMEKALRAGTIDAAVSYPPFATRMKEEKGTHSLFDSSALPGEICDTLIFSERFADENPNAVKAVVTGFFAARKYAESNRAEAFEVMAKREQLSIPSFIESLESGIYLPSEREQAALLAPGGPIEKTLVRVEVTLRSVGEIK